MRIERFVACAYGFAVLRRKPSEIPAEYWAIAKCTGGWRMELALAANADDWTSFVETLVGGQPEIVAYCDAQTGRRRFACYEDNCLTGIVFLAPEPVAVSRDWAVDQLAAPQATRAKRSAVVAGRPGAGTTDRGSTVCACFSIGANDIAAALARGCTTVAAVGAATRAGTNCGSCRAEIRDIIEAQRTALPSAAAARTPVTTV